MERRAPTEEELQRIEVTRDDEVVYVRNVQKLMDRMSESGVPDIDLTWTFAIARVGFLTALTIGIPREGALSMLQSTVACFGTNTNPPPVGQPPRGEALMTQLNERTQRLSFIAGAWQRKYKIHPADLAAYLLHIFATRMSYYGMPIEGTMEMGERMIDEVTERLKIAGERLNKGAGAS